MRVRVGESGRSELYKDYGLVALRISKPILATAGASGSSATIDAFLLDGIPYPLATTGPKIIEWDGVGSFRTALSAFA